MATNVGQAGNFGFDNLFKNAKKFYGNSNNKKKEDANANNDATGTSVAIAGSESPNDINNNNNNNNNRNSLNQETKQNDETPVLNKFRNFIKRNKSKEVEDIVPKSDNANVEIRSEKGSVNGVVRDSNPGERCRAEDCKNYALSNSLNPEKLTEIINNSIKAAVENLANDVKPPCWKEEKDEESLAVPLDSPCFNDTCPQRNKTINKKDNVASSNQYSQEAAAKTSGNICSIYENNKNNSSSVRDSKMSYNSNKNSSERKLPTCCIPLSKSGTTSAVCNQSFSKYKQRICPCKKQKRTDKSSRPCKLLKTDNRRMTGNVNIYICSEGNEGAGGKNNKNSESNCNSMTATNASCDCSSSEVCACQSITSSKTLRNIMTKNKNDNDKTDDINLKCACGKPARDCQCQSKNPDSEGLCLCDMSSLNPTTSLETCRDTLDYNLHSPNSSDPSPHGDYCVNRVRSRSSSRKEQCCTGQNFVGTNLSNCVENGPGSYVEKSKLKKFNSGNGDAVQDCSNCDTFSDYSDGKLNRFNCSCEANVTNNPPSRNQSERYVIQNIVNCGARREEQQQPCNCCKYDSESLYSSGKKSGIDESVCCKNKPRIENQKKEYCRKSYDNNARQRWRNSDYCIVEEDNEECDPSCCKFFTPKDQNLKTGSNSNKNSSWTPCGRESSIPDKKEEHPSVDINAKKDHARISADKGLPTSQSVATRMSVDEVVKSFSNVDKSTSSIFFSLNSSNSPQSSPPKPKESKKSSLKWPFSKAKSLISGKTGTTADIESKKNGPITDVPKLESNVTPPKPVKDDSVTEKISNGKITAGEKSTSAEVGGSLITIKSSNDGETKSKEFSKTKLSSSKLGSLIADRKNSFQSATNETSRSQEDNQSNEKCKCGAVDADMCICQYPHCTCCNRPEEYCKCDEGKNRREDEDPCNVCQKSEQLCCCINQQRIKKPRTLKNNDDFRVCTLCCRAEKNCCCNNLSGKNSSNFFNSKKKKNSDSYQSDDRKSQICIYCDRPREKCTCRAPIKKCSYCGMPVDVCNCQDVEANCNYEGNGCQCNGRLIENSDGGDQSICVTAWKPRREIRKYFSRNPGERDSPDCSCCETVRPYGSDELPYQRLSVFSDVMTELQQKMNELPCCNRCKKIPCCCYVQETKSYPSQRKSRSKSPPCRQCLSPNPCKCGGKKSSSYQICDRCRTTPCRCRRSRSTHRKPQAKCYYCKRSPCRCESIKTSATPKGCRCGVSPPRSEEQSIKLIREKTEERNSQNSRLNKNCRCRCSSPSYGSSTLRGQERRYG